MITKYALRFTALGYLTMLLLVPVGDDRLEGVRERLGAVLGVGHRPRLSDTRSS